MDLATLESLGITREEVLKRVVNQILSQEFKEEDSDEFSMRVTRLVAKMVEKKFSEQTTAVLDKFMGEDLMKGLETYIIQKTNSWGERVGDPQTFRQYITSRAEAYLLEKVDRDGRTNDAYGDKNQTRGAWIISNAIGDNLRKILSEAMMNAQTVLAKSVTETVKLQMEEIVKKFNLNITLQ